MIDTLTGIQREVAASIFNSYKYRRSRTVFRKDEHAGKIVTAFCEFKHKLFSSPLFCNSKDYKNKMRKRKRIIKMIGIDIMRFKRDTAAKI